MAIQTSGAITLSDIQTEFGGSNPVSLSEYYAGGSYVPSGTSGTNGSVPASGAISLSNFYGTSALFAFNITTNTTNANLRTLALAAGWDGSTAVVCTINSGVIISGNTAGNSTAAMTITGSFPAGVTLVNNGHIRGRGGNGGSGGTAANAPGGAGGRGGRALTATVAVSIDNQGNIWAGGGGGGGGAGDKSINNGGGGGGRSSNINSAGGAGSGLGQNGSPGTISSAGAGGAAGDLGGSGGAGGDAGAAGSVGTVNGAVAPAAGGAAGQAVNGNSNITWINTGSRLGVIA